MNVLISPLGVADVDSVIALARRVWQQTYPGIISQEQIDYMLAQRYGRERLLAELATPGIWWDLATADGCLAGFSACIAMAGGCEMKLDKLYVDPQRQNGGIGGRLLEEVERHARAAGCGTLILAVNKRNQRAIAAYLRYGFVVRDPVCVDIGHGFVMDDFIMSRSLPAAPAHR